LPGSPRWNTTPDQKSGKSIKLTHYPNFLRLAFLGESCLSGVGKSGFRIQVTVEDGRTAGLASGRLDKDVHLLADERRRRISFNAVQRLEDTRVDAFGRVAGE
jgi:hypothetical protein